MATYVVPAIAEICTRQGPSVGFDVVRCCPRAPIPSVRARVVGASAALPGRYSAMEQVGGAQMRMPRRVGAVVSRSGQRLVVALALGAVVLTLMPVSASAKTAGQVPGAAR